MLTDKRKAYLRNRYHKRRKEAFDKLGRQCKICQLTFTDEELELDHIDPATKALSFGNQWSVSQERWDAEVKKAQPLCRPCHTNKTLKDNGLERATHGTHAMYQHYNCRCELCKKANTEANRKYRKNLGVPE